MGLPIQNKRLYGTATVGTKGQIVIPADAREELDIKPGDRLYAVNAMNGSGVVFLKEEMLESMVEQLTSQVESFRALQNKEKKKE
jgi:AbrB family looped-hinge helix DNA binding protein